MGLFDFGNKPSINDGVKLCKETPGAVLLDVRDPDEYAAGHIPGAVNLPLSSIRDAENRFPDADTPLFVYCLSGARSSRGVAALAEMGFTKVKNIGGIRSYSGELEK